VPELTYPFVPRQEPQADHALRMILPLSMDAGPDDAGATLPSGNFKDGSDGTRTRDPSNSSGYFLGLAIAEASPSTRTESGIGASNSSRVLHCSG